MIFLSCTEWEASLVSNIKLFLIRFWYDLASLIKYMMGWSMAVNRSRYLRVHAISGPKNKNEAPSLKELALRYYATLGFFAPTPEEYDFLNELSDLYLPEANIERMCEWVLQHVVYGNEEVVLEFIQTDPTLVEEKATVKDYSGRTVDNATPFQAALRAGDEIMAQKIKEIYLTSAGNDKIRQERQEKLDDQFHEVFPHGHEAHLDAQTSIAKQFEQGPLNHLISAIDQASFADVQAVLKKQENNSELCQQLKKFKEEFTELSLREEVYNPNHLLKVFEIYSAKFNEWYSKFNNYDPLELFWCQVIGWEQRYMPANYAQAFCTGLANIVENHQPLQRTLKFHNYLTDRDIDFFPLDADANSLLGRDFGVYSYYEVGGMAPRGGGVRCVGRCARVYKTYVEQKQQAWGAYAASVELPLARVPNAVK